jgi:hypothetical protein
MKNHKWNNNLIQFARLIAEIEAAGGFTEQLVQDLCASMDLEKNQVMELVDRAQKLWDENKDMPTLEQLHEDAELLTRYPAGRNNEDEEQLYEWNGRKFLVYLSSGVGEVPPGVTLSEDLQDDEDGDGD